MSTVRQLLLYTTTIYILLLITTVNTFYLPGVAPREYLDGDILNIKVVKLDSVKTALPYEYYSLPFCQPDTILHLHENIGEILSGDVIENTLYDVSMKESIYCKVICKKLYNKQQLQQFTDMIDNEYRVNLLLDNIPVATKFYTINTDRHIDPNDDNPDDPANYFVHYEKGYSVGFVGHMDLQGTEAGVRYINNHLRFVIYYHDDPVQYTGSRIVGFEVEAYSVKHEWDNNSINDLSVKPSTCQMNSQHHHNTIVTPQRVSDINNDDDMNIIYTYDVEWKPSDIKWASRWDIYLNINDNNNNIHWFSIINSTVVVLFLSAMIALILIRILRKDLTRYNSISQHDSSNNNMNGNVSSTDHSTSDINIDDDMLLEDSGWKLIHGDVFRSPRSSSWLSILIGSGSQIFICSILTLLFAYIGLLSPSNRGSLMSALVVFYSLTGIVNGYVTTRIYKNYKQTYWKRNALIASIMLPLVLFSIFFILNICTYTQSSSSYVPFTTLISLLIFWFAVSLPLTYLGSYIAYRQPAIDPPLNVNNLARMIPIDNNIHNTLYTRMLYNPYIQGLICGILPFAAIFIEIYFIMQSIWLNEYYYLFSFLFIIFVILCITTGEITIVCIYFTLCKEDYRWHWRSFIVSSMSGIYVLLYSILYYTTKLHIHTYSVSTIVYFGYMLCISILFSILNGTIGYIAARWFVYKIYTQLKID